MLTLLLTSALSVGLIAHSMAAPPPGKGKNAFTLSFSVSARSFSENGGFSIGTVSHDNPDLGSDVIIDLLSSDTSEATVPSSVTIPSGASSTTFLIEGVDDADLDEDQAVTISVSNETYGSQSTSVTVIDDEALPQIEYVPTRVSLLGLSGSANVNDFNDSGMAVGFEYDALGEEQRAWLYDPNLNAGQVIDLNTLPLYGLSEDWIIASAIGINNNGLIVGYAKLIADPSVRRGYVIDLSLMEIFELPDADPTWTFTYARKVNDNGDILGYFDLGNGTSGAYLVNLGLRETEDGQNSAFDLIEIPVNTSSTGAAIDNPPTGVSATVTGWVPDGGLFFYNRDVGISFRTDVNGNNPVSNDYGDYAFTEYVTEVIPINKKKSETVTTTYLFRNINGVDDPIEDNNFGQTQDIDNNGTVICKSNANIRLFHVTYDDVLLEGLITEPGIDLAASSGFVRMNNWGVDGFSQIAALNWNNGVNELVILTPRVAQ